MKERIVGKFQGGEKFGFLIPEDREYYGGDFYVKAENFKGATDGSKVEGVEIRSSGKKPEVKIVKVYGLDNDKPKVEEKQFVEGIFSQGDGNFGFVDVEGQTKGYFVHGKNSMKARDGDKVKIEIREFKGKMEGIVVEKLTMKEEKYEGRFYDSDNFGFVMVDEIENDVFIAGLRKNGAQDGDRVIVRIISKTGKNPEGIIEKVL